MANDELLSNEDVYDLITTQGFEVISDRTVNTQLFKDPEARIRWLNAMRAINELDDYLLANMFNDLTTGEDESNS
jgi:hypothetical protein